MFVLSLSSSCHAQWPEWVYRAGVLEKQKNTSSATAVTPEKSSRTLHGKLSSSPSVSRSSKLTSLSSPPDTNSRLLSSTSSPAPKDDKHNRGLMDDIASSAWFLALMYVILWGGFDVVIRC